MEIFSVDLRPHDDGRNALVDIECCDLEASLGHRSAPPAALAGELDHLGRALGAVHVGSVITEGTLDEGGMQCGFHPLGRTLEPSLEVVMHRR
jgi:hypothetical protein